MTGALTLSLLCVLLSQDRPKLAIHPLQVKAERHEADLRIRFSQEVLQHRINSVGTRQIPTWLGKQPKASCLGKTECLKQMAEAMGATYVLYASLEVGEQDYVLSAKVIRADGEVVRSVEGLSHPRDLEQHWGDDAQRVFKVLLSQLKLGVLPVRPLMLAAEEGKASEGKAAEEGPMMELDLQDDEAPVVQGLGKGAPQRKGRRTVRGAAEGVEESEKAEGWQEAAPKVSRVTLLRVVEPFTGWAPPSSAWARPRYMELNNKPTPLRTTAYVMTGMGGATFIASGIFWLMAQSQKSFLEKNAPGGVVVPGIAPQEIWSAHKKAQLYPQIGVYLAGTGAVFMGAAATLFVLSYVLEEGMPFALVPLKGGVSLSYGKRF